MPAELESPEIAGVTELAPVPVMLEAEVVVPAVLSVPGLVVSVVEPTVLVLPEPVVLVAPEPVVVVAPEPVVPVLLEPAAEPIA